MAGSSRRIVHAAGALVWREKGGDLQVLLVHRPRYDDWSFPKGKLESGESLCACAVREVAEETGVQVRLEQPLETIRYRLGDGKAASRQAHAGGLGGRVHRRPGRNGQAQRQGARRLAREAGARLVLRIRQTPLGATPARAIPAQEAGQGKPAGGPAPQQAAQADSPHGRVLTDLG